MINVHIFNFHHALHVIGFEIHRKEGHPNLSIRKGTILKLHGFQARGGVIQKTMSGEGQKYPKSLILCRRDLAPPSCLTT